MLRLIAIAMIALTLGGAAAAQNDEPAQPKAQTIRLLLEGAPPEDTYEDCTGLCVQWGDIAFEAMQFAAQLECLYVLTTITMALEATFGDFGATWGLTRLGRYLEIDPGSHLSKDEAGEIIAESIKFGEQNCAQWLPLE